MSLPPLLQSALDNPGTRLEISKDAPTLWRARLHEGDGTTRTSANGRTPFACMGSSLTEALEGLESLIVTSLPTPCFVPQ